jgi:predicted Zn-dependent protease
VLLAAMQDELARSMERLRLDGHERPYFISYLLRDTRSFHVAGRHGAVTEDRTRNDRRLLVDVRVGSYELDHTGADDTPPFTVGEGPAWPPSREAPLDDDPAALRSALWLLTDDRYKDALASWYRKRGRGVYRTEDPDRAPSFTREAPRREMEPPVPFPFDRERWRGEVRALSAALRSRPEIFDATVRVEAERQVRWLASSEGTALVTEGTLYAVHLQATARALDGQLLEDGRDWYGRTEADLPGPEALRAAAREVVAELVALRQAPVLDPFTGPAILSGEATGVLFHEAVGHRLEGDRQDDDRDGRTFKGQVGRAVLPPFLGVVDDPTLAAWDGIPLNGHYRYDEQGVPAQRVALITAGTLEAYLLSRKPVLPFTHSNGHARSQGGQPPVARMANLIVTSSRRVPMAELKRMLVAEARRQGKPYGLLVRDVSGGNTNTGSYGYQAFKGVPRLVYRVDAATGREELVRGVELVGTPLAAVNRVLATDDAPKVFNGFCGAESGYVPVASVAPAALVAEVELQRTTRAGERGPMLPAPPGI